MEHPKNGKRPELVVEDGGLSRRAYRTRLREGVVGCIAARPRGAKQKPTRRQHDIAEGRWDKRNPLGPIERLIADNCKLRDTVPESELLRFDFEYLYSKVQGAVADAVARGIEESNERRAEAAKRGESA